MDHVRIIATGLRKKGVDLKKRSCHETIKSRNNGKKTRECLTCREPFKSEGVGNRMCFSCRESA